MRLPQTLKAALAEIEDLSAMLCETTERISELESDLDTAQNLAREQEATIDTLQEDLDTFAAEEAFIQGEFDKAVQDIMPVKSDPSY